MRRILSSYVVTKVVLATRSRTRPFAALGVVLLIYGCATTNVIDESERFEAGKSQDALIVMGIKATEWPLWAYTINWRRYDSASRVLVSDPADGKSVGNVQMEHYAPGVPPNPKFIIFRMPEGTYGLHSITVTQRGAGTLVYNGIYRPATASFTVAKGDLTYIGDFIFMVPKQGFFKNPNGTRLRYFGRNLDAAREALAQFPNVTGDLTFQQVKTITLE